MMAVGCDVGALLTKMALLCEDQLLASRVVSTGGNMAADVPRLADDLALAAGLSRSQVELLAATGQAGAQVPGADFFEDEVTCIGAAVATYLPGVDLVLHVGGQSIISVVLDKDGEVTAFLRNDKCAAGTGRFLEVVSRRLGVTLDDLDSIVARAGSPTTISSQCAVFAESEIITHLNGGAQVPDVLAGVCQAVAAIIIAQGRRAAHARRFTVTGGVGRLAAVVQEVDRHLQAEYVPFLLDPVLAAAIGAALLDPQLGHELDGAR